MKLKKKSVLKIILISILILVCLFLATPPIVVYTNKYKIYTEIEDVEETESAIVLGAGVSPEGKPLIELEDRLKTAIDLYESDKISQIYVSGDNRTDHHNEPQSMYDYLVENGVEPEDITKDPAGYRTYDTCYRASEVYEIDEAILISQGYHLPRAIYLCENFGIDSTGYSATKRNYELSLQYEIREIVALYWSVLDVYVIKPQPEKRTN